MTIAQIEIDNIFWANCYFDWGAEGFGFGQLSFAKDDAGTIICANECMSREKVRQILHAFADKIADTMVLEDDPLELNNED